MLAFLIIIPVALIACDSGNTTTASNASGTVSLYLTDDLSDYQHVTTTLNAVQLRHSGSNTSCSLLSTPQPLDITDLGVNKVLELADITSCEARSYNRLRLEFDKMVTLTDANNMDHLCEFTSYKDDQNRPNVLMCDASGNCGIDINGAVNVLAGQHAEVSLDFNLREFEADLVASPCTVSMKVSPIHAQDKMMDGYRKSVGGLVSRLDTTAKRFALSRGSSQFSVDYGAVTQPGIDTLLARAATDGLRTKVACSSYDPASALCTAQGDAAMRVKLEGTLSALDMAARTFTLTYRTGKTLTVDYSTASYDTALANDLTVEVVITGHNGSAFLARTVEIED
jgi:hypothetical protein